MATKDKTIHITCDGSGMIDYRELEIIQGNLKELSKENYEKLKNQIVKHGFNDPVGVWKGKVLDGTQRLLTVKQMVEKEGYILEGNILPIDEIKAKNLKEAKAILLAHTSQYGKLTDDGLYEFIQDMDVDEILPDLDLPDFDFDKFKDEWLKDSNIPTVFDGDLDKSSLKHRFGFPVLPIRVGGFLGFIKRIKEIEHIENLLIEKCGERFSVVNSNMAMKIMEIIKENIDEILSSRNQKKK